MKAMEFLYRLVDAVVTEPRWFTISGLTLDALGAMMIVFGVFVSRAKIENLIKDAGVYYGSSPNKQSPSIRDRIRQSRLAKIGAGLLVFGFVLQIVGNWPR